MNPKSVLKSCLMFLLALLMLMPAKMGLGQVPKKLTYSNTVDTSTVGTQGKPASVATYANGDYIVTFPSDGKVVKYSKGGVKQSEFGTIGSTDGTFQHAWGVALDRDGSIYVSDFMTSRLQKFTPNGTFVWSVNTGNHPRGLAVDVTGNIYVACEGIHCIEKYNASGQLILTFGNSGPTESLVMDPISVAITADGGVVVASPSTFKIIRYKSDGTYVWSRSTKGQYVWGVTTSWNGNIYASTVSIPSPLFLTQAHTSRIEVFSATGNPLETYESVDGAGRFDVSCGISCSPDGAVVVVDYSKQQVVRYVRSTGKLVLWGPDNTEGQLNAPDGTDFVEFASGSAHGIALKSNGTVVCWGRNVEGQCNVPEGLSGVVQVWAMQNSSLALKKDGTVVGWGLNTSSELPGVPLEDSLGLTRSIAGSFYWYVTTRADGKWTFWVGSSGDAAILNTGPFVSVVSGGWQVIGLRADGRAQNVSFHGLGNTWGQSNVDTYVGISKILPSHSSTFISFDNGLVIGIGNNDSNRIGGMATLAGSVDMASGYHEQPVIGLSNTGTILIQNPFPGAQAPIPASATPSLQLHISRFSGSLAVDLTDQTPPTSTFSATPSTTWSSSNVTATITSTDNTGGSGVKEIHYSINQGTEQVVTGSSASFNVSDEGVYSIAYWAVDNAGNIEATKYATVRIDKTAPSIDGYVLSGKLTLLAADGRSGVAAIKYSLDGAAALTYTSPLTIPAGAHTYTYYSVDNAGNESIKETILVGATVTVTLSPTSVYASKSSVAIVKLSVAAPVGGVTVMLASSNPAVTIAPSVKLNAGATSINVPVQTGAVAADTSAVITATVGGIESYATLVVMVPYPKTLVISPNVITGGNTATGTFSLQSAAPLGGQVVTLTSMHPDVTVPSTVTVLAGALSATFTVTTKVASKDYSAAIYAEADDAGIGTTVLVKRVTPKSLTFAPSSIVGGNTSVGTVTLNVAAPVGGATVILKSTSPLVTLPTSVTVVEGQTTATFDISTSVTPRTVLASIQAAAAGVKVSGVLAVSGLNVMSVTLAPNTVLGGTSTTGSVNLNTNAPTGGVTVQLYTTSTIAGVPVSVTVPAGQKTATFTITTSPVSANALVQVVGKFLGVAKPATLTVQAAAVTAVTLNPTSVKGGTNSTMTIKLSGLAGPSGLVVTLTSSNIIAATVPATVTVPAGTDTVDVVVTTKVVTANATSTLTAKTGAGSKTAVLTVTR